MTAPFEVPVEPDADEARRMLDEELAKTRYQQNETEPPETPEWIEDLLEWLRRLFDAAGDEGSVPAWVGILVVVGIAIVVVAFLVFGLPRLRARSQLGDEAAVFEAGDVRDGAAMRRAADAAAREGRYELAMAERFRAIARRLHERTLVTTVPGSTAHDVARRASVALAEHAGALEAAAADFDAVRYLGDTGDAERYARLVALDQEIERARPRADAALAPDTQGVGA